MLPKLLKKYIPVDITRPDVVEHVPNSVPFLESVNKFVVFWRIYFLEE